MLVRWLVFIHVLSAITFFLAHDATAAMVFRVRSETDFARIRAMLAETEFNALWVEGKSMTMEQAIQLALS